MLSAKWRPFCPGGDVSDELTYAWYDDSKQEHLSKSNQYSCTYMQWNVYFNLDY